MPSPPQKGPSAIKTRLTDPSPTMAPSPPSYLLPTFLPPSYLPTFSVPDTPSHLTLHQAQSSGTLRAP